jgi:hypothetical protein
MANIAITAELWEWSNVVKHKQSATPDFVLQAAKLYHEEQSPVIETMSIFWVIFVINLRILLIALLPNELEDVL